MKRFYKNLKLLLQKSYEEFSDDNCSALAGAVAYFGLFSLFPLTLLTLGVAGRFLGSEEKAKVAVMGFLSDYLPGAVSTAHGLVHKLGASHGLLSGLAIIGLVWAGSQILYYTEMAMNLAWDCNPRPWWKSRLRSIGFLLLAQLLILGYLFLSVVNLAKTLVSKLPGYSWLSTDLLLSFSLWFVPFVLSLMVFVALNKFLPNCFVSWRAALFGGLITATLFEMARLGFRFYLSGYANYDVLYGSIGGLFILVMWAYYGALAMLLGAELASEVEEVFWEIPRTDCRDPRNERAEELLRRVGIDADF
jgi:membrane protein